MTDASTRDRPLRVVVACIPQTGHIVPLLPVAEAFTARGDEVVLASGSEAAPAAASRGLTFRQVGGSFGEWYATLRRRTRGIPGDGLPPERVERYFLPRLFGEIGMPATVDDLVALCREFRPDLIVFDSLSFAAPLAAAVTGARQVHHTIGPLIDPAVLDLVTDAVLPVWREFGLDTPWAAGLFAGTTLTICPPSLDPPGATLAGAQALRPVRLPHASPQPPLPVPLPFADRPLVYLTLGTFSNTNVELFRLLLAALADEPIDVLVTVGADNDPAALGLPPANARVERFVPQADVLPHCAAAVHHAGAGTTFGVLAHGLPSVALPQSADNFTIADRLAAAGLARTLPPDRVAPPAVRAALREVLTEPIYRERARAVAAEIAAMPGPDEVVGMLHQKLLSGTQTGGMAVSPGSA